MGANPDHDTELYAPMVDPLWDYRSLGRHTSLSQSALRREVEAGRLRATRIGLRRVVFRPEDVADWLAACAQ